MLVRFEPDGVSPRPVPAPSARLEVAGLYLLIAGSWLVALSLVALHPEDDRLLIVGVVLLTIALAIWLPFILLIPGVLLVWLIPSSVHAAVETGSPTWSIAAVLAGQLALASTTRLAYKMLKTRLFRPPVGLLPPDRLAAVTRAVERERLREAPTVVEPAVKVLPRSGVLAMTETKRYLDRLIGLDRELRQSGEAIRATLRDCLDLMED
ncbi:MAG TPA: hypothetical protein VFS30_06455, partial [Dehalococcoidia bacterium]|nr:hypothetical protein [Dehalococcoidia bacterium]